MVVCSVCGNECKQSEGQRGRPSQYCSKNCREVENYYLAFEKRLRECKLWPGSVHNWRSRLFYLANEQKATYELK